jgi:hypothetical protein
MLELQKWGFGYRGYDIFFDHSVQYIFYLPILQHNKIISYHLILIYSTNLLSISFNATTFTPGNYHRLASIVVLLLKSSLILSYKLFEIISPAILRQFCWVIYPRIVYNLAHSCINISFILNRSPTSFYSCNLLYYFICCIPCLIASSTIW